MDQVLFPGDPSLPLAPAGLLPVHVSQAAATTHTLFQEPLAAAGYKKVPALPRRDLDTWRLSQDPTFAHSGRILS